MADEQNSGNRIGVTDPFTIPAFRLPAFEVGLALFHKCRAALNIIS